MATWGGGGVVACSWAGCRAALCVCEVMAAVTASTSASSDVAAAARGSDDAGNDDRRGAAWHARLLLRCSLLLHTAECRDASLASLPDKAHMTRRRCRGGQSQLSSRRCRSPPLQPHPAPVDSRAALRPWFASVHSPDSPPHLSDGA